ncbi:MAG: UbiX family flavin prenyltransferase [Alphaproteobacteria bacterium]|nr:UbiX family flavin prenyltransferase [Alphaproteobacteria bacterium]
MRAKNEKHLVIGITGASGAIYGIRMLEVLRDSGITTHLIVSKSAQLTIASETRYTLAGVQKLADICHPATDIAATIASGSFKTMGMVIAPCSIRTMSEVATGVTSSLLSRAADVTLKERRPLVLMVRETPLHAIHLENMLRLAQAGAIIAPPVPAFYTSPASIDDMVNHTVGRTLDLLGIDTDMVKRWKGLKKTA